jgi:hypothetical protein
MDSTSVAEALGFADRGRGFARPPVDAFSRPSARGLRRRKEPSAPSVLASEGRSSCPRLLAALSSRSPPPQGTVGRLRWVCRTRSSNFTSAMAESSRRQIAIRYGIRSSNVGLLDCTLQFIIVAVPFRSNRETLNANLTSLQAGPF